MTYSVERSDLQELTEIIEDAVSHYCDDNMISGELVWICVEALAKAKNMQIKIESNHD